MALIVSKGLELEIILDEYIVHMSMNLCIVYLQYAYTAVWAYCNNMSINYLLLIIYHSLLQTADRGS